MRSVLSHFPPAKILMALAACIVACSCASTMENSAAGKPPVDVSAAWSAALVQGDVSAALELVSDDFTSGQWATRDELADYLNMAAARGYFNNAMAVPGAPISVRSAMGTTVWNLTVRNSDSSARITSIRMEIY